MIQPQHELTDAIVAAVITVSDRSSRGERRDESGPRIVEMLAAQGYSATATVIPDGVEAVENSLVAAIDVGARLIITTGGTGIGPRDFTPEGTRPVLAREIPGIAEMLRREGARSTPMAALSRGLVGVTQQSLIVNLPGSLSAVTEGLDVLLPLVPHILDQLDNGDH
ncbi:molybdenum cofactor biosynthesis protein B [Salinibacterium sp. M195]|uniref:MogA/MoaB family molybdenum cofactor biosynthesis protein n=1 Tax=Salinibacterium sp. M195 TaxID=2583374 RepID=UPI001C636301|nr:MogA/MoaB family molybdenum cofactor biosynthesis protein [Salinibacterium sp. M195]QYH36732.1 MogA/MoaB family molybdenum cofactor biosynthesis protein [Salinibacterium sp. M195]